MPTKNPPSVLYYGDNLDVLTSSVKDEVADLVYLDPPFNSKADYNVLFREEDGTRAAAQYRAFRDTWRWDQTAAAAFRRAVQSRHARVPEVMQGFRSMLGESDMLAYLSMMAPRLIELHRVLKPTGTIYLHCDASASHYLKVLMDAVFGGRNFLNNVVWLYGLGGSSPRYWPRKHDDLLFYAKDRSSGYFFEADQIPATSQRMKGQMKKAPDHWPIPTINNMAKERLGYPTQKPEQLLERIVRSSCPAGGLVIDPFCGCGTSVAVAQRLGRRWIGIDITPLAINLIRYRFQHGLGIREKQSPPVYEVTGFPTTANGARQLAEEDKFKFQAWAVGLVGETRPTDDVKKGPDRGVDGRLYFEEVPGRIESTRHVVLQVKGGKVSPSDVRDLRGTLEREATGGGVIAALISLQEPTDAMRKEAASAGAYDVPAPVDDSFPKVQLLTVGGLLDGSERLAMPPFTVSRSFKQATRAKPSSQDSQPEMFEEE